MKKLIFSIAIYLLFLLTVFSCQPTKTESAPPPLIGQTEADKLEAEKLAETTETNHGLVMDMFLGKPSKQIRSIGILVYDGVNDLDFMGPKYVLSSIMGAKTQLIALQSGNFTTVKGMKVVPDTVIDSVDQLDILVIPGGFVGTITAAYDEKLLDWIRQIDQTTTYTTSVCTGGWILGATGLLQGKKATTNWYEREAMLEKYGATFVDDRYVQDGKYWTSAGVTAGMDMALAILNDIWGERYTQGIMLDMEYDPAPPIAGGTPNKTGFVAYQMMKMMYDAGAQPLIDSLDKRQATLVTGY
ncbi:MAG: DJ-1/PfpI family protein [Bacteroidota bacterium]